MWASSHFLTISRGLLWGSCMVWASFPAVLNIFKKSFGSSWKKTGTAVKVPFFSQSIIVAKSSTHKSKDAWSFENIGIATRDTWRAWTDTGQDSEDVEVVMSFFFNELRRWLRKVLRVCSPLKLKNTSFFIMIWSRRGRDSWNSFFRSYSYIELAMRNCLRAL